MTPLATYNTFTMRDNATQGFCRHREDTRSYAPTGQSPSGGGEMPRSDPPTNYISTEMREPEMTDVAIITTIETMDSMLGNVDDEDEQHEAPAQAWMPDSKDALKVDNTAKVAANVGKQIVSKTGAALTIATNATGGSLMGQAGWAALVSGATLGTGPIALLVASAALAITDAAKNGVSAYKTDVHIKNLQKIHANAASYKCESVSVDHSYVVDTILPYIIAKKQKKKIRKIGSAVPMIGSAIEQARAKMKAGYKKAMGTLGKNRKLQAQYLATHHCTALSGGCDLTSAIIAELFGLTTDEADATRKCNAVELSAVLSLKFKSV